MWLAWPFGALVLLERGWRGLTWFLRLWWQTRFLDRDQRRVLTVVLRLLRHPEYPLARKSVRKVAVTLGFNRPEAWKDLSHALKRDAGEAQNAFRHLEACRLLHVNAVSSTTTLGEAHMMIELAYQEFASQKRP